MPFVRFNTSLKLVIPIAFACFLSLPVFAQQPVVVQPGAPGQATRILPSSARATLPPRSRKDAEFMQGMIMHHAQAVEMTALIDSHTENKRLRTLGARISRSQSDEIKFISSDCEWLMRAPSDRRSLFDVCDSISAVISTACA